MNTRIAATLALALGLVAGRAAATCDTTPPCAPTDVTLAFGTTTACLGWFNNSTGDDGCSPPATATRWEIRKSGVPIYDWTTVPIVANGPCIGPSDQQSNFEQLNCSSPYYFVLFFFDEADNRSDPIYRSGTTLNCGGSYEQICDNDGTVTDLVAPCATTDPTIEAATHTACLTWNNDSSGDDGCTGLPSKWEIRQSTSFLNRTNWVNAQVVCRSTVVGSGLQGYSITGLSCNTTYYWVLFFFDDMGNRSVGVYRSATTLSCNQSLEVTCEYDYGLPCCP